MTAISEIGSTLLSELKIGYSPSCLNKMIKCSLYPILLLFIITAIVAVIVSSHCGCNAENFVKTGPVHYDRLIMHPCNESLKERELTAAKHTARVPAGYTKYFISN